MSYRSYMAGVRHGMRAGVRLPAMDATLRGRVLVVDDDDAVGLVLVGLLRQAGLEAQHVLSGADALRVFAVEPFDAVITDLRMPKMDGLELLAELKRQAAEVPVIVLTAHGTVKTAVEAMKAGAADYMAKPFDRAEVVYTVNKALTSSASRSGPPRLQSGSALLGESPATRECSELIERAAASGATVLVRGESGTGKEVAARAIHRLSRRHEGPFVAVNCAALPDQLLESELFGHAKGAFTGAVRDKPGRVDTAAGGTLFLDEIGDVSLAVQVKLLRLLQEKEFQALGANSSKQADVRFVVATHRDLEEMIEAGEFREDLYFRLNVIPLWIPPLRDRPLDVTALARHFIADLARAEGREPLHLSDAALEALLAYDWPGNVRELQNLMERLVVFCDGSSVDASDIERELGRSRPRSARQPISSSTGSLADRVSDAEREAVLDALRRADGNRTKAARLLGVARRTLYNRLAELGIADTKG